jgi:hypothetical protein
MSQSMKHNFHNRVDEEYIIVTKAGVIKCMYVCTLMERPAHIHFPNRATD